MVFDKKIAGLAISALKEKGVEIAKGLSSVEINYLEHLLGASIPTDLKSLLMEGLPLKSNNGLFPNWRQNPEQIVADSFASIQKAFVFDIEENGFWHESFGSKPASLDAAKVQAVSTIKAWPPLIRIYEHRYMPTTPDKAGNPIISIWQASDAVVYGNDLADYLHKEFEIVLPLAPAKVSREVPYWGPVFDL